MTPTSAQRVRAAGALAVVAAASVPLRTDRAERIEQGILGAVVQRRHPEWAVPARALTRLAEPPAVAAVIVAAAAWSTRRGLRPEIVLTATASATTGIVARRLLAEAVGRNRPPRSWWWDEPAGFSYPSRHVTWAVLGYGAAADLLGAVGYSAATPYLRAVPVGVVAATRVILAVHWPSDVLAALGFAVAWRRLGGSQALRVDR